jgi:hypothetical protein
MCWQPNIATKMSVGCKSINTQIILTKFFISPCDKLKISDPTFEHTHGSRSSSFSYLATFVPLHTRTKPSFDTGFQRVQWTIYSFRRNSFWFCYLALRPQISLRYTQKEKGKHLQHRKTEATDTVSYHVTTYEPVIFADTRKRVPGVQHLANKN